MKPLSKEQIEELKSFDTPTVSNAIERFNIRSRVLGHMGPKIKSIFPEKPPMVGYACTAKVSAAQAPTDEQKELIYRYYKSILDCEGPPIAVIQDVDESPIGSFWGEVQANTHKALGCRGVVTNGGVRDLDEVKELGFNYFASCVLVSHGYIHVEQVGVPVHFGGLTVRPGDLLHADKHGVLLIPEEIAGKLADACRLAQEAEIPVLDGCRNTEDGKLTIDQLRKWRTEMAALRAGKK
jgi:4-hydroxy-4-methyl-2-oxoglutarate aldolase